MAMFWKLYQMICVITYSDRTNRAYDWEWMNEWMNEKAIVMDWMFVILQNSHAEVLTPSMADFGDGVSRE